MNSAIINNRASRPVKGFTLMEMLIVIAIIAVLVVIAIPTVNAQLEKAREAADVGSMRSAKALAIMYAYDGIEATPASVKKYGFEWEQSHKTGWGVYSEGVIKPSYKGIKPYGQGTAAYGGVEYNGYHNDADYTESVIEVSIWPDQRKIVIGWKPAANTSKSRNGGGDVWTGGGPADGSSQEVIYY